MWHWLKKWKMPLCKWYTFWMATWLLCCFTDIILHIEGNWLLKKNLATILPLRSKLFGKFHCFNVIDGSIEMLKNSWISKNSNDIKSFKTFYESQILICMKEIFQSPTDLKLPPSLEQKCSNGNLGKYTDICFPSAPRRQFLGV